ncbi:MAG: DUF4251 domain-containing protein [Bacteroidota bacterium]
MKSVGKVSILFFLILALSCKSTSSPEVTAQQIKELEEIMDNKSFEFRAQWARPLVTSSLNSVGNAGLLPQGSNINNIDLTGNANYFRMYGDSVAAYFPYYGEKQLGGGGYPPNENSIKFEGIPEKVNIEKNQKGYNIKFYIKYKIETYQVNAQLFPSKKGNININSTHRFPITYQGTITTKTSL